MRHWIIPAMCALTLVATCTKARTDTPNLPPGITCEIVRYRVAQHGKVVALLWAKLHGYSRKEINEARRCLVK